MYDSFWIGSSFALIARLSTFKMLRWPLTSSPLSLVPQLVMGGLFFSLFDVLRRIAIEQALKVEEANEFNKQLRKDDSHYDL